MNNVNAENREKMIRAIRAAGFHLTDTENSNTISFNDSEGLAFYAVGWSWNARVEYRADWLRDNDGKQVHKPFDFTLPECSASLKRTEKALASDLKGRVHGRLIEAARMFAKHQREANKYIAGRDAYGSKLEKLGFTKSRYSGEYHLRGTSGLTVEPHADGLFAKFSGTVSIEQLSAIIDIAASRYRSR